MKRMTHRTTFALDEMTAKRIRCLAMTWHVSQAEVVRRAVAMAEMSTDGTADPTAGLRSLHAEGCGIVREDAVAYLAEVDEARRNWRGDG